MQEKDLGITEVRGAKANIPDLQVYGDGDAFALFSKASSKEQGWMKSTKVCNLPNGCLVQITTQQKNLDGSYAVAEALTFVPYIHIDKEKSPREFKDIAQYGGSTNTDWVMQQRRAEILEAVRLEIITREQAKELLGY